MAYLIGHVYRQAVFAIEKERYARQTLKSQGCAGCLEVKRSSRKQSTGLKAIKHNASSNGQEIEDRRLVEGHYQVIFTSFSFQNKMVEFVYLQMLKCCTNFGNFSKGSLPFFARKCLVQLQGINLSHSELRHPSSRFFQYQGFQMTETVLWVKRRRKFFGLLIGLEKLEL